MTVIRRAVVAAAGFMLASGVAVAAVPEVGTVIDASNVDQYADYLIESRIELIRRGEVLKVYPRTPDEELITPWWREATERNRGKAVLLDDAGTVGLADGSPWIGGTPFPEPKTGLEVMVNYNYCDLGLESDDWGSSKGTYAPLSRFLYLDRNGKVYKEALMGGGQIMTHARLTLDPKPAIPGMEDEFLRRTFLFLEPYDAKGIVTLDIQYRDQSRLPDSYIYLPTFRRVRRVSTANRADALAGSEFTQSDVSGFSDPVGLWSYEIVARRKMLLSISRPMANQPYPQKIALKNKFFPTPHSTVELRDAYIVEATPKYDTIYGRKLIVLDAAVFRDTDVAMYDRQGKLYKGAALYWGKGKGGIPDPRWSLYFNFQTGGGTMLHQDGLAGNTNPPLRLFEPSAMKELSR